MRMNKLSFFSKAEVNVLNQIIKAGALVCALAMLEWNPAAVALETRLGVSGHVADAVLRRLSGAGGYLSAV